MTRCLALTAVFVLGLAAADAGAQVTVGGGVTWASGYAVGGSDAQLRRNTSGVTPASFTWFETRSRMTPAVGAELRIGVDLTPRLMIEGGATFGRPHLRFTIDADTEAPSQPQFDGESVQHYVFDAALVWRAPLRRPSRIDPFVLGGAGYLRQLHQERTLVETGQVYYAGGGARIYVRGRPGSARSFGLRADVRMNVRRRGIDFENKARVYPSMSGQVFFGL